MYRFPAESTATPLGSLNCALVAGPLSPLYPSSVSRDRSDHPVRDFANAIIVSIRDVQIPGGIDGDDRRDSIARGGRAAVPAVAKRSRYRLCVSACH